MGMKGIGESGYDMELAFEENIIPCRKREALCYQHWTKKYSHIKSCGYGEIIRLYLWTSFLCQKQELFWLSC